MIVDWQKWMKDHHVKMRGDPDDDGSDAVLAGRKISRTEMETEVSNNAGTTSNCSLQESVSKTEEEKQEE